MSDPAGTADLRWAFDDSRRLTGPNRWYDGTAVELSALGGGDVDGWRARVVRITTALGWPDPKPIAHRHASGLLLAFAAPAQALFTATEINEWSWEQGGTGFDRAHAFGEHDAAAVLAARAQRERSGPLQRLQDAAAARGLPAFIDDDALTLGAGSGAITYPRAALPLPMDVPWPRLHDIPKVLVTGSNGKTTTVRLLAAMAAAAGHVCGLTSTEGIGVGGESVSRGDYSGPAGARAVLRDARVTLAVLETARGGIARRGLALERADAAIVTNVSADHFGEYGIDGLDDLAELKLVVARAVRTQGVLVLNADDAVLMSAAERLPHAAAARRALVALDHDAPALAALRARGGATCGVRAGRLLLALDGVTRDLGAVTDLPLSARGAAAYNVMNMAAAALAAAAGLRLPIDPIGRTLHDFGSRPTDNPGRLERHTWGGATVLIDYAHNPDGLARLLAVARALPHRKLLLLLGQAGNRDDAAIEALAAAAAAARPDTVMLKELPDMLRGRMRGEVPGLLRAGLRRAGVRADAIVAGGDEAVAVPALLGRAQPGDMVVLPIHSPAGRAAAQALVQPNTA